MGLIDRLKLAFEAVAGDIKALSARVDALSAGSGAARMMFCCHVNPVRRWGD